MNLRGAASSRRRSSGSRTAARSCRRLHGRCLELFGALTETRARVHELETLLYLKQMDEDSRLPGPFAHFSDC
ncbi:hypothetical protein OAO87_03330 [bacterium]|nr:hypothetical protein [bacterium]